MTQKTNRQELIVEKATELFFAQGYSATSVRQIAEAAGCTDAALYYHFRDGKRALFQAVIETNLPDFMALLEPCRNVASLPELIVSLGKGFEKNAPLWGRISWLVSEFPHLSSDEKQLVYQVYLAFQVELSHLILPFVHEAARAEAITWLVICAMFGYAQTFVHFEMQNIVDLSFEGFKENLAQLFVNYKI
jgi:AcrR family transcriptional regulator